MKAEDHNVRNIQERRLEASSLVVALAAERLRDQQVGCRRHVHADHVQVNGFRRRPSKGICKSDTRYAFAGEGTLNEPGGCTGKERRTHASIPNRLDIYPSLRVKSETLAT